MRWEPCRGRHTDKLVRQCPVHGVRLTRYGLCPVQRKYSESLQVGMSATEAEVQALHEWGRLSPRSET